MMKKRALADDVVIMCVVILSLVNDDNIKEYYITIHDVMNIEESVSTIRVITIFHKLAKSAKNSEK
jgi:hypothetical protein